MLKTAMKNQSTISHIAKISSRLCQKLKLLQSRPRESAKLPQKHLTMLTRLESNGEPKEILDNLAKVFATKRQKYDDSKIWD